MHGFAVLGDAKSTTSGKVYYFRTYVYTVPGRCKSHLPWILSAHLFILAFHSLEKGHFLKSPSKVHSLPHSLYPDKQGWTGWLQDFWMVGSREHGDRNRAALTP